MAIDLTSGVATDAWSIKGNKRVYVQFKEIDCAVTNLSATNFKIFNLPAGSLVLCVAYQVVTPEGAADTFDLGDSGNATRFYSNQSANQTAGTRVGTYVTPLFYPTADSVILNVDTALTVAKLRFWVVTVDMSFT
jgi:hypothetical protein